VYLDPVPSASQIKKKKKCIYIDSHLLYNRNLYIVSKIIAAQINSFSINGDTVYMKHKILCDQSAKCTLGIIKTSLKLKSRSLTFSE
jgi:hypothetical protein